MLYFLTREKKLGLSIGFSKKTRLNGDFARNSAGFKGGKSMRAGLVLTLALLVPAFGEAAETKPTPKVQPKQLPPGWILQYNKELNRYRLCSPINYCPNLLFDSKEHAINIANQVEAQRKADDKWKDVGPE